MMDYKEAYQLHAEELAQERYGMDFYDLSSELQSAIYDEAMRQVTDNWYAVADQMRDEEKYR